MYPLEKKIVESLLITCLLIVPLKSDIPINTRKTNDQKNPAAAFSNGNYIVAWDSYRHSGDSNSGGIVAGIFDSNCCPVTGEFLVNETTAGNQKCPDIAADANGNFVIVWQGPGIDEEDIFAKIYDANANTVKNEFRINNYTTDRQLAPAAAMNSQGSFIIVWESFNVNEEPDKRSICGRLFDKLGNPTGPEFTINSESFNCRYPDAVMFETGYSVVTWTRESTTKSVWKQFIESDGTVPFFDVEVSTNNFSSLTEAKIAADAVGNFIIVWDAHSQTSAEDDIYIRTYHYSHAPLHEPLIINSNTEGAQSNPSIDCGKDSCFLVAWENESGSQIHKNDIIAQHLTIEADYIGPPFLLGTQQRINTYTVDEQKSPSPAAGQDKKYLLVWQSDGQDGSGYGIFAKIAPINRWADFDGNNIVNFNDYQFFAESWMRCEAELQANLYNDNKIDAADLAVFSEQWLSPVYQCQSTDIETDGTINFRDFCYLANNWLKYGPGLTGDFTGNGEVDSSDLQVLLLWWTKSCK